jgi:hypothetical protein
MITTTFHEGNNRILTMNGRFSIVRERDHVVG